jgi:hypothetical protein
MLKKRIRTWGIDKKNKKSEMLIALRMFFDRQAAGKPTEFVIRDRVIRLEDLEKYFKRKGIHDLSSLLPDAYRIPDSDEIDFRTPPSSPRSRAALDAIQAYRRSARQRAAQLSLHQHSEDDTTAVLSDQNALVQTMMSRESPILLAQCPEYEVQEKLLGNTDRYYDHVLGSFTEERFLEVTIGERQRQNGMRFSTNMFQGFDLLENNQPMKAFKHFNIAFDEIYGSMKYHDQMAFLRLHGMLLASDDKRCHEVVHNLIGLINRLLVALKLPKEYNYPPYQGSRIMARMDKEQRVHCATLAFESMLNRCAGNLPSPHAPDSVILDGEPAMLLKLCRILWPIEGPNVPKTLLRFTTKLLTLQSSRSRE